MERIFFIGDIHGCNKTFRKMITEEIAIRKTDRIYCVGDYIDRGNDSKGVVDFILELKDHDYQIHTLRGNHEQMLLDSGNSPEDYELWLMNGGNTTLRDFNAVTTRDLKQVYMDFFTGTEYFIETDEYIVTHAGLNFNSSEPLRDNYSMLWIRDFQVDDSFLGDKILIHGHTPVDGELIRTQDFASPFNIDGGCVYKHIKGMGSLFALNFYEQELLEVPNID